MFYKETNFIEEKPEDISQVYFARTSDGVLTKMSYDSHGHEWQIEKLPYIQSAFIDKGLVWLCPMPKATDAEVVKVLLESIETEDALKKKTNPEIAELLIQHVWPEYGIHSAHSQLVDVAIDRLKDTIPSRHVEFLEWVEARYQFNVGLCYWFDNNDGMDYTASELYDKFLEASK